LGLFVVRTLYNFFNILNITSNLLDLLHIDLPIALLCIYKPFSTESFRASFDFLVPYHSNDALFISTFVESCRVVRSLIHAYIYMYYHMRYV